MTYHIPAEFKAGYTTKEREAFGDTVLMNWRDWRNLRDKIQEGKEEVLGHPGPHTAYQWGYVAALDDVMTEMDETLP